MPPTGPTPRSYAQLCGIATGLDVIGDRWAVLILRDLILGPMRFGELVEGLPGIGTNTLAARLRDLEGSGVIRRQLLPLPDRGTVYELTAYGREVEPILLALGRWGTKSMGRLPSDVASRSRWLVAGMLAFHDAERRVAGPTTWELRLTDGAFAVRADGTDLTITAGAPDHADVVIATEDDQLHRLLTHRLAPSEAVETGAVTVEGDGAGLSRLLELFAFPALEPAAKPAPEPALEPAAKAALESAAGGASAAGPGSVQRGMRP
jgi:DNA-binding HxlR family transcriptional regulator